MQSAEKKDDQPRLPSTPSMIKDIPLSKSQQEIFKVSEGNEAAAIPEPQKVEPSEVEEQKASEIKDTKEDQN